jgi:hypothetical protein
MPTYDFKCHNCGKTMKNVLLRITHDEADRPGCCGETMRQHFTVPPSVVWVDPIIEPFRAIATKDRPVITTARQNREYMERNNLIDANELGPPPSHEDQKRELKEINESIAKVTPSVEQKSQMRDVGVSDIV